MTSRMKAMGIDRLTVSERLELVHEIWGTIEDHTEEIGLTEAQRTDLDRRVAEEDADPNPGSPMDEVRARLKGKP